MRDKINARSMSIAAALLLEGWALYMVAASPRRWRPSMIVKEEPAARALYETMMQAIGDARSLSYVSTCSDPNAEVSRYRVWLQKPGSLRVEMANVNQGVSTGDTSLLNDGASLWIHWSGDRPTLLLDNEKSREEPRSNVYMKKATRAGKVAVRAEVALLGTAWVSLIFDSSTFHGCPDPLEPYLDGIRSRGTNRVQGEECDVIEISFLRAQRTRFLWLSRQDHLPRKLKEIVRGAETHVTVEEWSNVTINGQIPPRMLAWSGPQGWRQWEPPKLEDSLLRRGQEAPDFKLHSARRGRIRLSDYRGRVVWLYVWDSGTPQCREEIPGFQQLHHEYKDKGLTALGFNCTDDRRIARAFVRENSVTFPSVLDASETAARVVRVGYGNKVGLLPLNYIIDPQGKVVDGWFGSEQDPERVLAALKAAGLELAQ